MLKSLFVFSAFLVSAFGVSGREVIGNDKLRAEILTPEESNGLDRDQCPRFDRLGAVTQIQFDGRRFLTRCGLTDEFGILAAPPGYTGKGEGGEFMKIGVGVLLDNAPPGDYKFFHPYPVSRLFKTVMKREGDRLVFEQNVPDFQGYSYEYRKTCTIAPETGTLEIAYFLRNTGSKPISTSQYNHNFFAFASGLDDSKYLIRTMFDKKAKSMTGDCFLYRDRTYSNLRETKKGCYLVVLEPIPASENRFEISHPGVPCRVTVSGDFPSERFAVSFTANSHISPEIFIRIELRPGEELSWRRTYVFSRD